MSNATTITADFDLDTMASKLGVLNDEKDAAFKALAESYQASREAILTEERRLNIRMNNLDTAYYTARDEVFRRHGEAVAALSA